MSSTTTSKPTISTPHKPTSSSAVEAEIEQTRREMDETLDLLDERIRPQNLIGDAANWAIDRVEDVEPEEIRKAAGDALDRGRDAIADHPIISGCIAAGAALLGWGFFHSHDDEKKSEVTTPPIANASRDETEGTIESLIHDHPLGVGLGVALVGFLSALSLPRTDLEDRWMGKLSDESVKNMQKTAAGLLKEGKGIAEGAALAALDEIHLQELDLGSLQGKIAAVGQGLKEKMRKKGHEAAEESRSEPNEATIKEGLKAKKDEYVEHTKEAAHDVVSATKEEIKEQELDPQSLAEKSGEVIDRVAEELTHSHSSKA